MFFACDYKNGGTIHKKRATARQTPRRYSSTSGCGTPRPSSGNMARMKSAGKKVRYGEKSATTSTTDRFISTDEVGASWYSVGATNTSDHGIARSQQARGSRATNGDFLGKAASAVYCLHSRYFRGVKGHDRLLVRLCTLCREADWMGPPICSGVGPDTEDTEKVGGYREIDPFILEEVLSMVIYNAKTRQQEDAHPVVLKDQSEPQGGRTAINRVIVSFEDLYHILVEIATLVYPLDTLETDGSRSPRAMQRLLLEGVFPIASEVAPRLWSPRWAKEPISHDVPCFQYFEQIGQMLAMVVVRSTPFAFCDDLRQVNANERSCILPTAESMSFWSTHFHCAALVYQAGGDLRSISPGSSALAKRSASPLV